MDLSVPAEIRARVKITKPDGTVIEQEIPQDDLELDPALIESMKAQLVSQKEIR